MPAVGALLREAARRAEPRWSPRSIAALSVTSAVFVVLAILAHRYPILPGDLAITRAVQSVRAPWFQWLLRPFNLLGFPPLVDIVYGGVTVLVFLRGWHWAASACAFGGLGSAALNWTAKALVARPRPPADLVHVEHIIRNSTFPAGHVLNFTTFAGFLAYLAWLRLEPSWRRSALVTMLAVMIALMGLARIDSGEHWTSDVLGGYLLGSLWLAATIHFYRWEERRFVMRAKSADPRSHGKSPAG
jgi:undecaprenyl-diphosphatase